MGAGSNTVAQTGGPTPRGTVCFTIRTFSVATHAKSLSSLAALSAIERACSARPLILHHSISSKACYQSDTPVPASYSEQVSVVRRYHAATSGYCHLQPRPARLAVLCVGGWHW
jgi:hypothetical protein